MTEREQVKLISFDIWSTLLKSNPTYKEKRAKMLRDALSPDTDVTVVKQTMDEVDKELDALTDRTGTQYGFEARILKIWELLPSDQRINALTPEALEAIGEVHQTIIKEYPPFLMEPDLRETLLAIRNYGIRVALISNTGFIDGKYMRTLLNVLEIWPLVDYALFSNEVGVTKPDNRVFDLLSKQSGVAKEHILHVGDNIAADYDGARNAGLQALHLSKEPNTESEKIACIRELLSQLKPPTSLLK